MAERKPGLFLRLLGKDACAAAVAQSKAWLCVCSNCGFRRSVWDMGGIRYKASGGSQRTLLRCPNCGQANWHSFEKAADFPADSGPTWPLVRLIIGLILTIGLVVAGILLLVFKLTGLI